MMNMVALYILKGLLYLEVLVVLEAMQEMVVGALL